MSPVEAAKGDREDWARGVQTLLIDPGASGFSALSKISFVGPKGFAVCGSGGLGFATNGKMMDSAFASGIIYSTTDEGLTWSSQTVGTHTLMSDARSSHDADQACAVGLSGAIQTTADGGETWRA